MIVYLRAFLTLVVSFALTALFDPLSATALDEPSQGIPEIEYDFGDVCERRFDEFSLKNSQVNVDKTVELNGQWAQSTPGFEGTLTYNMSRTSVLTVEIFEQARDGWGFPTGPKLLLSTETYTYTNQACPSRSANRYVFIGGRCDPSSGLTTVGWRVTNTADLVDGRPAGRPETVSAVGARTDAPTNEMHAASVLVRDGETEDILFEYVRPRGVLPGNYVYNFAVEGAQDAKRNLIFPSCASQVPFPVDPDPRDNRPPRPKAKLVPLSASRMKIDVSAPSRMDSPSIMVFVTANPPGRGKTKTARLALSRGERTTWRCGDRKSARTPETRSLKRTCIKRERVKYTVFMKQGIRKIVLAKRTSARRP